MKLIISLIYLIVYTSLNLINITNGQYILNQYYNELNCGGEATGGLYSTSGVCDQSGYTIQECDSDGNIDVVTYEGWNCTGKVFKKDKLPQGCSQTTSYSCVSSINIPTNTIQTVITESQCENDPNWKDHIVNIEYSVLNVCTYGQPAMMYDCNQGQNYFLEYMYNQGSSCSSLDMKRKIPFNNNYCDSGNPRFSTCNK